jgi:hypothetical protein
MSSGIMSIDGFWHHRKTQIDSTAPAVELVSLAKKRWIYFSIHSKDTIAHRNDIVLLTVILALRQNDYRTIYYSINLSTISSFFFIFLLIVVAAPYYFDC